MNYIRILTAIFIMALVTYLPRMLPLAIFQKKIENRYIKSFLAYVPYAVLAAMTFPEILYSTGFSGDLLSPSPALFAAIAGMITALLLAYRKKGLLTVALGATGAALVTELIIKTVMGAIAG